MRILIVGGSGFIGKSLTAYLANEGYVVSATSFKTFSQNRLDASSLSELDAFFRVNTFDCIINLAGSMAGIFRINECASSNIVQVLDNLGQTSKVIHVASSTEFQSVQNTYESEYSFSKEVGTTKFQDAILTSSISGMTLFLHNTYGEYQPKNRFIAYCIETLKVGKAVELKFPNRVRDFVFQPDVNKSFTRALEDLENNNSQQSMIREIGTGLGTSLHNAVLVIADAMDCKRDNLVRDMQTEIDLHPHRVANIQSKLTYTCGTGLREGIGRIAGGLL